jgi:hypothetical protein
MFWVHVLIYIVLIAASYIASKKYNDKVLRWFILAGSLALIASTWQYSIENIFVLSEQVQATSLLVVQGLRVIILVFVVVAAIRALRR